MSSHYRQHLSSASIVFLIVAELACLAISFGCSSASARLPSDPEEAGRQIAERRCDRTHEERPYVESCVNDSSRSLQKGSETFDRSGRVAMIESYQETFAQCPWDDPKFYE